MATVTPEFLWQLQRAGWVIVGASTESATVKCPMPGCQIRTRFAPGKDIPKACATGSERHFIVRSYDEGRKFLKERRADLLLTIPDVENIIGCADDHLAKFERDSYSDPSLTTMRMPNAQLLIDWANSLGFDVALVPSELPRKALFVVADTRHKAGRRSKSADGA
jgi:hypothetical protein